MKDISISIEEVIREKYENLSSCLSEKSRRIWAASEAMSFGWGGITVVHKATGIDHKTIRRGIWEIRNHMVSDDKRVRKEGGGRKNIKEKEKGLEKTLESLMESVTRGDPESSLQWTSKSTHNLSKELRKKGYSVSQPTVCKLLSELGYSLQANKKTTEGSSHPDRNSQFQYINRKTKEFHRQHQPVISVTCEKRKYWKF